MAIVIFKWLMKTLFWEKSDKWTYIDRWTWLFVFQDLPHDTNNLMDHEIILAINVRTGVFLSRKLSLAQLLELSLPLIIGNMHYMLGL